MNVFNNSKYKPYISKSLNKQHLMENFTKESLEKASRKVGYEIDRRKKLSTIVDEIYDLLT
jgi:hypothetical protein